MSIELPFIPDFTFMEVKVRNPIDLAKALDFIQQKIKSNQIFSSLETLFWVVSLLSRLNKPNLLDKKRIKDHLLELKHEDGGYKFSTSSEEPDTWSTFYSIAILKALELDEIIEENDIEFILNSQISGDGGFLHCKSKKCHIGCNKKTSFKSSLFGISALNLLERIESVEKKRLLNHLKKDTQDNMELIYQILSLNFFNELDLINLEKKIPIIASWQIRKTGFGIESKFPSVEHTFWAGICLGLLERFESISYIGMIEFLKSMQHNNGGFTGQYMGISRQEPNLQSTAMSLMSILYLWNKLSEGIEEEILLRAKDLTDIYLIPIAEAFSVSNDLVKEVANWLLSNKWLKGEILDRMDVLQAYYNQQNLVSQEVINSIMKRVKTLKKQKELDITELSKQFSFSNPLERVKLVINDLIINRFITGNIKAQKKRYVLENFSLSSHYIHLIEPLPYDDIIDEKNRKFKDKSKIMSNASKLSNIAGEIRKNITELIEQEKVSEAQKQLKENLVSANEELDKFEELIEEINSSYKYVDFKLFNFKFEDNWKASKNKIKESLSTTKLELEEKIKAKEAVLTDRSTQAKEQEELNKLYEHLKEVVEKIKSSELELQKFFPKNYENHEEIMRSIKDSLQFIDEFNSKISSSISDLFAMIKSDNFKDDLEKAETSWQITQKEARKKINNYKTKIEMRIELEKLIAELTQELVTFSDDKSTQIMKEIEENRLNESSKLLNEYSERFKVLISKQDKSFNDRLNQITEKMPDFYKISKDLVSNWSDNLKSKQTNWVKLFSKGKDDLHSSLELEKKGELEKKLKASIEDVRSIIENMKGNVSNLIDLGEIVNAENVSAEKHAEINQKIKLYNQEHKEFIKTSSREFKTFRETVNDLTESWEKERPNLIQLLDETNNELKEKIDEKGSKIKKEELNKLIKDYIFEIKSKLNGIKQDFNEILKSGKKLIDSEMNFDPKFSTVRDRLKITDNDISTFIKTASKSFSLFNDVIDEENSLWNNSKSSIERKVEEVSSKIGEDILIQKMQSIITAFKGNKVDLNYLSKTLRIKLGTLKLKLIELISDSKIIGEIDPSSDIFFLKEESYPEKFSIKEIESRLKEIPEKEVDPIKNDILRLRYLLVIHSIVGASVFSRKFGDWKLDTDLVSGFLTAIQSFGTEFRAKEIPIRRMEYKEFEILMEQGKKVQVALIIEEKESTWIRDKLKLFRDEFEKEFEETLQDWRGELSVFNKAAVLVDKAFELYRV